MSVVAVIPVRAKDLGTDHEMPTIGGRPLIGYTIEAALAANRVDRVLVSTDSERVRALAQDLGAEAPFVRPSELSEPDVPLDDVLRHAVQWLADQGGAPEVVVLLEIDHPVRPDGLIDLIVEHLQTQQLDTVFAAMEDRSTFWEINAYGELVRVHEGEGETRSERRALYKELSGLASATRAELLSKGERVGVRVGLVPIPGWAALIDTRSAAGLDLFERLMEP